MVAELMGSLKRALLALYLLIFGKYRVPAKVVNYLQTKCPRTQIHL